MPNQRAATVRTSRRMAECAPARTRPPRAGSVSGVKGFVRMLQDLALIVVRLCVGLVLFLHGWHRFVTVGMQGEIARVRAAGLPFPTAFGYGAVTLEMIGGVLLAFGLATPLIGLGMLVENILIIAWFKASRGYEVLSGGWEYNLVLAAFGLLFLTFGGGRGAIDTLFRRRPRRTPTPVVDESEPA